METVGLHSLSTVQERRVMTYIEDKSLDINRAFQKRHMSSSKLRTLPDYISAIRVLIFDVVMIIPPRIPSGELRVSLLLRLTADLLEAAPEYPPFTSPSPTDENEMEDEFMSSSGGSGGSVFDDIPTKYPLVELFDVLHDLDNAWAAVISCQVWNQETRAGEDVILPVGDADDRDERIDPGIPSVSDGGLTEGHGIKLYAPSPTECARLRSIVLAGMSVIEDWLDEGHVPDKAKQPFEECFDWTLRLLGEDSNEASWIDDGFVGCGAAAK